MTRVNIRPRNCPICGDDVEQVEIDHERGQVVFNPCRHVSEVG